MNDFVMTIRSNNCTPTFNLSLRKKTTYQVEGRMRRKRNHNNNSTDQNCTSKTSTKYVSNHRYSYFTNEKWAPKMCTHRERKKVQFFSTTNRNRTIHIECEWTKKTRRKTDRERSYSTTPTNNRMKWREKSSNNNEKSCTTVE